MYRGISIKKQISGIDKFLSDIHKFPINSLELGYEICAENELYEQVSELKQLRLYACELISRQISDSIYFQTAAVINDFKRELLRKIMLLGKMGVKNITINVPFEDILSNHASRSSYLKLLKYFNYALYQQNMIINFDIAIPFTGEDGEDTQKRILLFLKDLMSPFYKISVNIYPHKLNKNFKPELLLKQLKFEINIVRFVYEPELGNHLVSKSICPWVDFFSKISPNISLLAAPFISKLETIEREITVFTNLLNPVKDG